MLLEDLYRLMKTGHVQAQGIVDTMTQLLSSWIRIFVSRPQTTRSSRLSKSSGTISCRKASSGLAMGNGTFRSFGSS